MSARSSTIECYNCHQRVASLAAHRPQCPASSKSKSIHSGTVKCFDCGLRAQDLKAHRLICTNSRYAKSILKESGAQPRPAPAAEHTDFYCLLDVSGSMAGARLDAAKATLLDLVKTLDPKDRLAIITFDDRAFFKLRPRPVEQIVRQQELPELLQRIFARGATALFDAIHLAASQIRDKTRPTRINVLTDGENNASNHSLKDVQTLLSEYPKITLNIIQIGDRPHVAYQELCQDRGAYELVQDAEIEVKLARAFRPELETSE